LVIIVIVPKGRVDMQPEKGFSLVEVVVSLALISIVLLSFYPFLINSKKMSDSNMERLVVINLADATLERLKVDPYSYIEKPSDEPEPEYLVGKSKEKSYTWSNCSSEECKALYSILLNEKKYNIDVKASQNSEEGTSQLIRIIVTVKNINKKISYSVEGYVTYGQTGTN